MKTTKIDKQNANVTYTGTWTGLAGGTEVQLEDISDEDYATGNFGDDGKQLADTSGAGAVGLIEGTDYNYDERLDDSAGSGVDLYDDGTSGALTGKLRVVENGKNVTDATGLNLKVRAKNLSTNISPPADECYIDPAKGKVALPRPVYWSKCESVNNLITTPEIGSGSHVVSSGGFLIYGSTYYKFANGCISYYNPTFVIGNADEIELYSTSLSKFTLSAWFRVDANSSGNRIFSSFRIATGITVGIDDWDTQYVRAWIGNVNAPTTTYALSRSTWYHFYIVVDDSKSLTGGKSIRVFIDGTERLSSTSNIVTVTPSLLLYGARNAAYVVNYNDNIKLWNHVVSEDPSFEYNSGTGREDALHEIYGSGNDYKPSNIDVGYYYIAESTDPAKMVEADSATSSTTLTLT